MWQDILHFILDAITHIADWWNWLNTPILIGVDWLSPLTILGSGFLVIIGLWIVHLVNPFG